MRIQMVVAIAIAVAAPCFACGGCGESTQPDAGDQKPKDTGTEQKPGHDSGVLADTGVSADSGTADSGVSDAGTPDVGTADTGVADAVPSDAHADAAADAARDTGPSDTGQSDSGFLDSGLADGGPLIDCIPPTGPGSPLTGRVFGALSYSPPVATVYEVTSGTTAAPRVFASVPANGWLGPMVITPAGDFFAATNQGGGSIFNIKMGGTFTATQAIVTSLFSPVSFIEGMAYDASNGRFYLTNSESGMQPIDVVSSTGAVSHLPRMYDNANSLLLCGGTLLISEGNTGKVFLHDTRTHTEIVQASGFRMGGSHISSQLIGDHRGHVLVLWSTPTSPTGLFDITQGGDFTMATPLVTATFSIDVNQIAVDPEGNIYVAGNGTGNMYVARFNGTGYAPFVVFATGLSDNESAAAGP